MSPSLEDASLTMAKNALTSLTSILKKAEGEANSASFPAARIYEDMFPLSFQVHVVTDTSAKLVARLSGTEPTSFTSDGLKSFADFYERIAQVEAIVEKADKALIAKRVDAIVPIGMGRGKPDLQIPASDYVVGYAIPNIFFHLSTAYNILRKEGVPLGKGDYLDAFTAAFVKN